MAQIGAHRKFLILFVCTGNICRSSFSEVLARHLLATGSDLFEFASAGVAAVVGAPMHVASRAALEHFGAPSSAAESFRARQLTAGHVAAADLVLGAAPIHRGGALQLWPQALPLAFTLREFARLVPFAERQGLPLDPVARAAALVGAVRAARGMTPPCPPEANTVPDPMGRPAADHLNSARIAAEALHTILTALAPGFGAAFCPTAGFARD
jgi:protein-tyrosine phosphatase